MSARRNVARLYVAEIRREIADLKSHQEEGREHLKLNKHLHFGKMGSQSANSPVYSLIIFSQPGSLSAMP